MFINLEKKKIRHARQKLRALLGSFPKHHFKLIQQKSAQGLPQTQVKELTLAAPSGELIRAFLTGPLGAWNKLPAVLYCHAHGNRYAMGANELIEGRPALLPKPYGQVLAEQGFIALSIDMPCFGLRADQLEAETSKRLLYQGQTLFGQMLAELGGAFDYLSQIDGVDPKRIGVFGFSMGATHAFWLAALEHRIKAVAHACAFADLGTLVQSGAHDLHGVYMTVPRLLQHFSTGDIAGLIAPRPQLICAGLKDPLTPEIALTSALEIVTSAYASADAPDHLMKHISPDFGHVETLEMREAICSFFQTHL